MSLPPSNGQFIQRNLRYNITINLLDGGFFGMALGFASFITIIPLFVSRMTDSALLIGLVPAIHNVGWQFPQLLTAGWVSRAKRIKPLVLVDDNPRTDPLSRAGCRCLVSAAAWHPNCAHPYLRPANLAGIWRWVYGQRLDQPDHQDYADQSARHIFWYTNGRFHRAGGHLGCGRRIDPGPTGWPTGFHAVFFGCQRFTGGFICFYFPDPGT